MIDRLLLFAASALLFAGNANAQERPPSPDGDESVVIEGRREIPPKVASRYVRQITSTSDGQLTRFRDPVCPLVIGLPDRYAETVASRIRKVATDAGAKLDKADCAPNLVLIIATDADAFVQDLRNKVPALFNGVDDSDLRRAFRKGPVHAWAMTEILNEDGVRASGGTLNVRSASILKRPTQQAIVGAILVIDDDATIGKSLAQIGDYVAMRALANALPPRGDAAIETILTLFGDTEGAPRGLTLVDQSYLKGLYTVDPTSHGLTAQGRIARQIRKDAAERSGISD